GKGTPLTRLFFVFCAAAVGKGSTPIVSRQRKNIAGLSEKEASRGGKWLGGLKKLPPAVTRIAIIYNPDTAPYGPMFFPPMQNAAPAMGVALSISPVHTVAEIEHVVAGAGREPGGGLIVLPASSTADLRQPIVALTTN